jgi:hypothetical protein
VLAGRLPVLFDFIRPEGDWDLAQHPWSLFGQPAIAMKVVPEKRKAYEGIAKLNAKQQEQNGRS